MILNTNTFFLKKKNHPYLYLIWSNLFQDSYEIKKKLSFQKVINRN